MLGGGLAVIEGEFLLETEDASGNLRAPPLAPRTAAAGLIHYQSRHAHR